MEKQLLTDLNGLQDFVILMRVYIWLLQLIDIIKTNKTKQNFSWRLIDY